MKKIYFLFLCLCSKFIAFAQRGFRPELDLQEPYDPDEYAPTAFDPRGFTFLLVIIFIIILVWVINSQKKKRKYKANKSFTAYKSMDEYYRSNQIGNYENLGVWIEKGTICTKVRKTSSDWCYATFESYHWNELLCKYDDLTRIYE